MCAHKVQPLFRRHAFQINFCVSFTSLLDSLGSQSLGALGGCVTPESNKGRHPEHRSETGHKEILCSTHSAHSPHGKTATLLLCLQPLYDFCNEITVCFPHQWALLMGPATSLFFLFHFKVSSNAAYISVAAALTAASTCETKMLISQAVPIGIMPRSAAGEG